MALTLETRQNNKNTAGASVSAVSGNNNGGLLGGSAYLNEKMALGFLSSVEGIWDYTAGGIAKLFGADQWAERQFANDLVNYNHADEWFDPGKGWQIAGDVAGGIGTSLPAIAAAGGAAALTVATGGAAAPAAVKILSVSVAPLVAGLGAAGNATKSAYQKTGELGLKEFGYGALSGATEAGVEALTAGIGTGTGRIVSSLSKRAAGETVSTLGKSGAFALLKTLGADFASEAIEEGLAEAVDPLYQRWTKVDPNAQNASAKEIGYAALVGGLSGIVMSGGAAAVNTTANLFSGDSSIKSGTSGAILDTARQISEYESANDTGYKSFQTIRDAYSQLSASLAGTGGQVSTVKQKMLLGSLKQAETAAFVEPFIERSAMSLLTSSESAAERFSALGMTDANGKPLTFTAEQIRSGVDADLITKLSTGKLTDTERRTLTKQVRKAIGTNSVLTTLAVMDATGRISMDAEKFAQAALSGRQIATAADLNRFIETASPAQIENLSKKLKIDNWAALTPDVFQSRVAEFNATEEGQAYRAQMEFVKQAQTIADSESKKLPRLFRSNTVAQGLTHYASADGRVNMALLREGDRYHLYDYETGNPSRDLTLAEVNSAIRPYWNAQGNAQSAPQAAQEAQKHVAVQTEGVSAETPAESATAAQTVRLNMIASENITDWRGMSEPNRAAVRMTMRQALAAGMDEDTALTFGRVAERSGMNIVFSAEQSGEGDARISGNTIYIDPNADKGRMENKLLLHEAGHALMREAKGVRLIARAFETVAPDRSRQIAQRYQKHYQKLGMRMDQYLPIIDEEIAVAGIEDTLGDINAWEYILSEEPSFGNKILNFFRKSAQDYSSSAGLSKEARKLLNTYKKMFAELSERNRGNNAITLASEAKMAGDIYDSRFSLKYADTIAYNQRITAKNRSFITMEELDKAIADTDRMVGVMKPHEKILPKDKEGKTLVKNGSYDVSVENTTVCIRTLSYNAFVDMVSEKIHRPLSQMESFLVSQKLYDIAKEPQCLYCYVSLDRKAYNEMLLRYLKQRDDAVAAYEAAGRPEITRSSELYEKFRNTPTKRKDTDEMWDRYRSWIDAVNRGEHLLTADEIATETRREELAKKGGSEAAQVKDMLKYAQSASWAKKQTQYAAYFGDILRLSPRVVNNLNRHYGLRWYSFSDYSGAFIVENMQQITDASIRGLKGLSYTKDTDFAKIFAPTGMNINISVYAKRVGDHYEIDPKQSADLQEAIALRKKYPNVGIVAVATDQAGVEWALEQEWSDVVIPFHTVRTGAQVAEFYDWTVFNEEQNDSVKDENLWKAYVDDVAAGKSDSAKKKVSKMVYPSEHQNNREKYLKLIEERGLKPRFSSFLDNPNYMKLVNETRQSEAQTSALKPVYDLDAAERSFAKFVEKGGYYEGWYNDGIDVDAEAEIVVQDIRAGKKANEVEYGRQDVDYEQISKGRKNQRVHGERFALPEDKKYIDAVKSGDMDSAQRMVDEAAKKAGYTPVKRYHQTGHKFTRFSNENPDAGLNDSDTPNGYFFKDNDHDIGVGADFVKTGHGGSIQMEVYLNDSNLLYFENRDAAQKWYSKHVPEYAKILQEYNNHIEEYKRIDKENTAKMFEELNALVEKGEDTAENELAVMDKYDKIIDGWIAEKEEYETSLRAQMRKLLNTYFIESDSGYNGIELADDGHRYIDGKREDVHTYIVFNNTQIKSAAPVTYDDNGNVIPLSERFNANNSDIRYALPEDGEKKTSETRESIMTKVDPEYKPTIQDKVFSGWTAAQISFTNAQAGIEAVGKKYKVKNIESLVQAARSGGNQAEEMIAGNQYRIGAASKAYQGEGLEQILRSIYRQGEDVKGDFYDYLFNWHNISRMTLEERSAEWQKQNGEKGATPLENKPIFSTVDENGNEEIVTAEQSKEIIKKYDEAHPEFKETAEKLWAFLRNLNQYRVDTGLISKETYDYLEKLYPHYVPTYRTGANKGIGAIEGKYNLKVKTTIKTAKGSTRALLPPDVMIARQVMETIRAGRINQLANALYEGALNTGDTTYIEVISKKRVSNADMADLDPTEIRPKNNEVIFFRDGEQITMRVSKEIFAGFNAFNPAVEIHNPLINGARKINNGFKRIVTSLNPAFLIRNAIRDVQDAGINTKYGKTFVKNYARASYEISHNGKLWQLYKAMGGFSSSVFDFEKGFSGMQNKWGLTKAEGNLLKQGLQSVENANAFVEQLPRLAEFISSIEAGNNAEQAILDSADVTTNFGRSGNVAKELNRTLIPFLNPSIQGFSKMIRNITSIRSAREFASLAVKATIVGIVPMVLNMLMYDDDEEYKDLRETDKENNFLFKIGDTFIKIPRGRVASVVGGLVNRGKETIDGKDADWAGYVKNVMQQVTPVDSMSRTIFSPFSDVANNLTWYGSAIEGRQFENTAPKDRYDENTSSIAIAIGKVINYSPKKIHYLLDQYSGVIGDFILPATTAKAEKDFLSGNFTIDPATSNKLSAQFYKIYDEAQYAKTSGDDTAAYQVRYLNKVKSAVSEMYRQKSEIQNDPNLTRVDKLQQTRVVQLLINEAYKTAIEDFELYTKAIEATAGMEDESLRFVEATRLMYGAERALSEYNADVYEKCNALNKAGVDYDVLYNYYFTVRSIAGDKDVNGNTINGSKRKKVVAYIKSMKIPTNQKLLLISASGYSLQDGDVINLKADVAKRRLIRYIVNLSGASKSEKAVIAEICGFKVNNGRVLMSSLNGD